MEPPLAPAKINSMNEADIRKRLNEIDRTDRRGHARLMEQFRQSVPQVTVQLIKDCSGLDDDYICHLYTFDIPQNSRIFLRKEHVFPIFPALRHCTIFEDLEKRELIQSAQTMQDAQIIVYYWLRNDREVHIHSGRVEGQYIISKWGRGHAWRHHPRHVPSVFEDNGILRMRFFKQSNAQKTMAYLEAKAA
jgi:hypothetical protein